MNVVTQKAGVIPLEIVKKRLHVLDVASAEVGVVTNLSSHAKTAQVVLPVKRHVSLEGVEKPKPGETISPTKSVTKVSKVEDESMQQVHPLAKKQPEASRFHTTGKFVVKKHSHISGNVGRMVARVVDIDEESSVDEEITSSQEQAAAEARLRIEQMNLMRLGRKDFGLAA